MDELAERIEAAKTVNAELERLIADFMPFLRKTIYETVGLGMEVDDRLSLAMLTFMNCVKQFDLRKGNFLAFAATCIKNRLIDESRRQKRHSGRIIPLFPGEDDSNPDMIIGEASMRAYNMELERQNLSDEISVFSEQLEAFGIFLRELPVICPKQERSRKLCVELGRYVINDRDTRETLFRSGRLAQASIAKNHGLSEKTIEKHRKFIITIAILLAGDYPMIRAFLPQFKEVKE